MVVRKERRQYGISLRVKEIGSSMTRNQEKSKQENLGTSK